MIIMVNKNEILVKNQNSRQKLKFCQNQILRKNRNSCQKFWLKTVIVLKNQNSGQKLKVGSKIEIIVKNQNLC